MWNFLTLFYFLIYLDRTLKKREREARTLRPWKRILKMK
jgi:hypothetical protein